MDWCALKFFMIGVNVVDQCAPQISAILKGIEDELLQHPLKMEAVVLRSLLIGKRLKVFFQSHHSCAGVSDGELIGSTARWGDLNLTILEASLEKGNHFIVVDYTGPSFPKPGSIIFIQLPQYLRVLRDCWKSPAKNSLAIQWLTCWQNLGQHNDFQAEDVATSTKLNWLRPSQRAAFQLPGWKVGFLFGPPGTGKTTVVGALLASYLHQFPNSRILLVSNTNQAVDQCIVAVDKNLEVQSRGLSSTTLVRLRCTRFGSGYNSVLYQNRNHLLADIPHPLIKLPSGEIVRSVVQGNRLGTSRIVAMTVQRALHCFDELIGQRFNLLVVDEASQVALAPAAMLAAFAPRVMFTGDPYQLSPIVKAATPEAQRWMGNSVFSSIDELAPWVCYLNEQSRMAPQICTLVSLLFYKGKLTVARDCLENEIWQLERQVENDSRPGHASILIRPVQGKALWSAKYMGLIRLNSAETIQELIYQLARHTNQNDILVTTPFRAQEKLIKEKLQQAGMKQVTISTVHRVQGNEFHTVIFDPVDGAHRFLSSPNSNQIINVAMSRAKAKLILLFSASDLQNALLKKATALISRMQSQSPFSKPGTDWLSQNSTNSNPIFIDH